MKEKIIKLVLCVLLMAFSASSLAENLKEKDGPHPLVVVGIFEGLIAVNAWMASKNPNLYGGLGVIVFPVAGAQMNSDIAAWASLVSTEALAIYNLNLNDKKYSENEIFRNNVIGWHIIAGIIVSTQWLIGDSEKEVKLAIGFVPLRSGGKFKVEYQF